MSLFRYFVSLRLVYFVCVCCSNNSFTLPSMVGLIILFRSRFFSVTDVFFSLPFLLRPRPATYSSVLPSSFVGLIVVISHDIVRCFSLSSSCLSLSSLSLLFSVVSYYAMDDRLWLAQLDRIIHRRCVGIRCDFATDGLNLTDLERRFGLRLSDTFNESVQVRCRLNVCRRFDVRCAAVD